MAKITASASLLWWHYLLIFGFILILIWGFDWDKLMGNDKKGS